MTIRDEEIVESLRSHVGHQVPTRGRCKCEDAAELIEGQRKGITFISRCLEELGECWKNGPNTEDFAFFRDQYDLIIGLTERLSSPTSTPNEIADALAAARSSLGMCLMGEGHWMDQCPPEHKPEPEDESGG